MLKKALAMYVPLRCVEVVPPNVMAYNLTVITQTICKELIYENISHFQIYDKYRVHNV